MRLLQIKLDGFGQFNHGLSIKLEPSKLNLIVGRNEAGKSTLLNATSGILFGFRDLNVDAPLRAVGRARQLLGRARVPG